MSRFFRGVDFHSLSVRDLADARDAYHVHLANLENVVGTALGRQLIRRDDPGFTDPDADGPSWSSEPKTLSNSGITKWSWPCVLVFVRDWMVESPRGADADQVVPRRLYLPDGRQVPTCVVHTPLANDVSRQPQLNIGSITRGAGLPLFTEDQGRRRMGTVGALLTDGCHVYALTSRHVLGSEGSAVNVAERGHMTRIGTVSSIAAQRDMQSLYPGVAATRAELSLDAGLVALDSVQDWTTQLYGLGKPGDLIDVNVDTVALSLIGCPVKAFGAATGHMEGTVLGLFHRWRSVGGVDQIAELLIGPRPHRSGVRSRPGDSGTVWVWDERAEADPPAAPATRALPVVRPIAMQWGGRVVLDASGGQPTDYVLASTMASVAQTLGVGLLNDDSMADHSLYWGKVGHYKVAGSACRLGAPGTKLAKLLERNLARIAVSDDDIATGILPSTRRRDEFVALADVPDLVWRSTRHKDAPNHFADMDQPGGAAAEGHTLMQLWHSGDRKWRTPAGWTAFYDSLPNPPTDRHRGSLPFRVAQLYELMTGAVRDADVARYVAAAGVLAHYVGDACQPLHISQLHHGEPDTTADDRVHAAYETDMLDQFAPEVVTGVNARLAGHHVGDAAGPSTVTGPDQAADAVVTLMQRTIEAIKPADIVEVFTLHPGRGRTRTLWEAFGEKTMDSLAEGAKTLAMLWHSAWGEAGGETIAGTRIRAQSTSALQALYDDKDFAPNVWLKDWDDLPPAASVSPPP